MLCAHHLSTTGLQEIFFYPVWCSLTFCNWFGMSSTFKNSQPLLVQIFLLFFFFFLQYTYMLHFLYFSIILEYPISSNLNCCLFTCKFRSSYWHIFKLTDYFSAVKGIHFWCSVLGVPAFSFDSENFHLSVNISHLFLHIFPIFQQSS